MKNYLVKFYYSSGKVETVRTKKKKAFLKNIAMKKRQNGIKKVYLKVSYGKKICGQVCLCEFLNETYCNSKDLLDYFKYFDAEE